MALLQSMALAVAVAALSAFAAESQRFELAQIQPGDWGDGRNRLSVSPGEICAVEGGRLYGIPATEFKTVSVQQAAEGKKLVRLSVGKDWYACTLDRLHGLVDFRGG